MKNKKLTFNSLAFGNLKHRKKQYTLLVIGIILSMVFSSGFVFFVSSAVTSAIETHNYKYGKQSEIVTNVVTNDSLEAVLNETYEDTLMLIDALKNTTKGEYTHRILWATDCPVGKFNQTKVSYSRNLEIFKQMVLEKFYDEKLLKDLLYNNAKKLYAF